MTYAPPHVPVRDPADVPADEVRDVFIEQGLQQLQLMIDSAFPGREQSMLQLDLAELSRLMQPGSGADFSIPGVAEVFSDLVTAQEWVQAVRRAGAAFEDACASAATLAELQAVPLFPDALGDPPPIRARDSRAALDAVQGK
jgi:hypothetical protein